MKKYIVKEDCIDRFYGRADSEYVEECQNNGIPTEDIEFMLSEYGEDIYDLLEEI